MEYLLDTNIFLRVLVKEDERSFGECYRLLDAVHQKKVHAMTMSVVFAELFWVLSSFYKFERGKVLDALEYTANLRGLQVSDRGAIGYAITIARGANVKFIDTIIASHPLVRSGAATIVSYDKEFDRLDVPRMEPAAVLRGVEVIEK